MFTLRDTYYFALFNRCQLFWSSTQASLLTDTLAWVAPLLMQLQGSQMSSWECKQKGALSLKKAQLLHFIRLSLSFNTHLWIWCQPLNYLTCNCNSSSASTLPALRTYKICLDQSSLHACACTFFFRKECTATAWQQIIQFSSLPPPQSLKN